MAIELHCHSIFSCDGYPTPETLVEVAAERGVTCLALTDHNSIGGVKRAAEVAKEKGIRFITGVEIDTDWKGLNVHLLAFGFDPDNKELQDLLENNRPAWSPEFDCYIEGFHARGIAVDLEQLKQKLPERYPTHPSPVLNHWFARGVLIQAGVFPDRHTFNNMFAEIHQELKAKSMPAGASESFTEFDWVRDAVHAAGGILLQAHVAKYFRGNREGQFQHLRDLLEAGLDGFEVYHADNVGEPHFEELVTEANVLGCPVSGGSDCHNANTEIGAQTLGWAAGTPVPDEVVDTIDEALKVRKRLQE